MSTEKKYRLLKEWIAPYIQHPTILLPGEEVVSFVNGSYKHKHGWLFPASLVENNTDWFELIEERDWEILAIKSKYNDGVARKKLFHFEKKDEWMFTWDVPKGSTVDGGHYNEDYLLNNGNIIHSVKRLSDGEVFTVGDWVWVPIKSKGKKILSFNINEGGAMFLNFKENGTHGLNVRVAEKLTPKSPKQETTSFGFEILEYRRIFDGKICTDFLKHNASLLDPKYIAVSGGNDLYYKIHKVKRLSDGEVFTVGDEVESTHHYYVGEKMKIMCFKIESGERMCALLNPPIHPKSEKHLNAWHINWLIKPKQETTSFQWTDRLAWMFVTHCCSHKRDGREKSLSDFKKLHSEEKFEGFVPASDKGIGADYDPRKGFSMSEEKEAPALFATKDFFNMRLGDSYWYCDTRLKKYAIKICSGQDIKKGIIQFAIEENLDEYIATVKSYQDAVKESLRVPDHVKDLASRHTEDESKEKGFSLGVDPCRGNFEWLDENKTTVIFKPDPDGKWIAMYNARPAVKEEFDQDVKKAAEYFKQPEEKNEKIEVMGFENDKAKYKDKWLNVLKVYYSYSFEYEKDMKRILPIIKMAIEAFMNNTPFHYIPMHEVRRDIVRVIDFAYGNTKKTWSGHPYELDITEKIPEDKFPLIKEAIERVLNGDNGIPLPKDYVSFDGNLSTINKEGIKGKIFFDQSDIDQARKDGFEASREIDTSTIAKGKGSTLRAWHKYSTLDDYLKTLK